MNKLDKQYTDLLQDILDNGVEKKDRTGTGTISVFGRQIRHNMKDGFPLLTTKKISFKTIVTELLWFLRGETNIRQLVYSNCHIWDGDCYKNYLTKCKPDWGDGPDWMQRDVDFSYLSQDEFIEKIKTDYDFADKWGDLGPIYGKQWRNVKHLMVRGIKNRYEWIDKPIQIDQIKNSIELLKTDPDSRRNRVSAWNVGELDQMVLPPCHTDFQFYTRELSLDERMQLWQNQQDGRGEFVMECLDNFPTRAISLMWNQRSVDTFLGLPFNIASYGLLLEIVAKEVNMIPDELIGNLGDTHLYLNHIEQAKEQIGRELSLDERLDLADIFNPLIREDCLTKSHDENEPEPFKLIYRHEWLNSLGVIPKQTREPFPLPNLRIKGITDNQMIYPKLLPETGEEEFYEISDFILENYQSHPIIKAPLSN